MYGSVPISQVQSLAIENISLSLSENEQSRMTKGSDVINYYR